MHELGIFPDTGGPEMPTTPTSRPSTLRRISSLTLLRDLGLRHLGGRKSRTVRELRPFLQFIGRKQLSRLHLESLPAIGVPDQHTMLGRQPSSLHGRPNDHHDPPRCSFSR